MEPLVVFCKTHGVPTSGASFAVCTATRRGKRQLKLHSNVCFKWTDRMYFLELGGSAFDVPWQRSRYIGRAENANRYPLRGFLMPVDEQCHLYYSNRRREVDGPGAWQ